MSALSPDEIHIWTIALDMPGRAVEMLSAALADEERARRAGLHEVAQQRRFTAARGAARVILGGYLGVPPQQLRWRVGRWGKPMIAGGLCFSLSHSGNRALLAVTGGREVGVDVERRRDDFQAVRFAARYFPPDERELVRNAERDGDRGCFARLWTRKEACVKAAGVRLGQGLKLPVAGSGAVLSVRDPAGVIPGSWLVRDVAVGEGYVAAVAATGGLPYRTISHQWRPDA
ncbi:4'-phosphopantetheinyl transferase family protein [Nocardia sp. CA-128927]|uniref:4'-phosphopantetheinyl transferase family protein n=1 Tax=Nocardia sp. CA-128927 TaxID=3239975 RepID=UPI003D96A39C